MKDYGKALKILRKNANITQSWLAERLNVTYQTVSKWENGVNTPDISVIEDICALFGVSVEEYLRLAENEPEAESSDASPSSEAADTVPTAEKEAAATTQDVAPTVSEQKQADEQSFSLRTAPEDNQAAPSAATPKKKNPDMPYIIVAIVLGAVIALTAIITSIVLIVNANSDKNDKSDKFWYVNARAAMFTVEVEKGDSSSEGVGFFIDKKGNAVVGYSTIAGIMSATVRTAGGKRYGIDRILGIDSVHDVAVVHVRMTTQSTPIALCKTSKLKPNDRLYIVDKNNILNSSTTIKSSANNDLRHIENGLDYIQTTDIAIGSSMLINGSGELVGFNAPACNDFNLYVRADDISGIENNIELDVDEFSKAELKHSTVKYIAGEEVLCERDLFSCEKVPNLQLVFDGMEFLGWYADVDFVMPFDFSQKCDAAERYVFAKTKQDKCKVLFDGGVASGSMTPQLSEVNGELTLPANGFTRKGYKFDGWLYGDDTYAAGEKLAVPNAASIRVHAVWTPIEYTVKYKYGDDVQEDKFTYDYNTKLQGKLFEREGYKQVGWVIGSKSYALSGSAVNLSATDGATVVASPKWEAIKYTMCIDVDPHWDNEVYGIDYNSKGKAYITCEYDKDPLTAINLTTSALEFDGWEVYDVDGELYTGDLRYVCAVEGARINVKAKWRSGEYMLVLFKDRWDTDFGMVEVTLSGKEEYTLPSAQSLIKLNSVYIEKGYEFKRWVMSAGITFADGETVSDLLMKGCWYITDGRLPVWRVWLYMQTGPISYTVQFDGNGGEGSMNDMKCVYGSKYRLPQNKYERDGYLFGGWDCGEYSFSDGGEIENLTDESNAKLTLTAKWIKLFDGEGTEQNPYKVSSYTDLSVLSRCVEHIAGMDSAHYILTTDIDCEGQPLSAIGYNKAFTGVFDGNGHVIKNPTFVATIIPNVDYPRVYGYMGLFAKVRGSITRLGIENYTMNTQRSDNCYYYAPLVYSYQSETPLENCYAKGTITLEDVQEGFVSGLVGSVHNGTVRNCFSEVSILYNYNLYIDRSYVTTIRMAGFVASSDGATVENCYADVNFDANIGSDSRFYLNVWVSVALFSAVDKNTEFNNCFAAGSVHGNKYKQGSRDYFHYCGYFSGSKFDSEFNNIYTCAEAAFDDDTKIVDWSLSSWGKTTRDDLRSLDWLVENMSFDPNVWVECETGLPELKAFEVKNDNND